MAEKDPEMVLFLSEKLKSFLLRMFLQSKLISLDDQGKELQSQVNQLLAKSMRIQRRFSLWKQVVSWKNSINIKIPFLHMIRILITGLMDCQCRHGRIYLVH